MRKKEEILNVIFINIPITLVLCIFAQLLTIWEGNAGGFSIPQFLLNIPIAYIAATLIGLGIPSVRWGMKFADSRGARSGGLAYALLMNIVVNTVYTLLLSIIMTFVNVFLIAHGPIFAVLIGIVINFIPLWIVCYIVSFFPHRFAGNLQHHSHESPRQIYPSGFYVVILPFQCRITDFLGDFITDIL